MRISSRFDVLKYLPHEQTFHAICPKHAHWKASSFLHQQEAEMNLQTNVMKTDFILFLLYAIGFHGLSLLQKNFQMDLLEPSVA